jgi:Mycoplasma protein of unknown function, DUF285
MFFQATAFDQDVSTWNTTSVANVEDMFAQARSYDQGVSSWDVPNVEHDVNFCTGPCRSIDSPVLHEN